MARFHVITDGDGNTSTVPFTAQEEADQDVREAAETTKQQRLADLSADALTLTAIDLLKNNTAAQIKTYMTNNVTTLAQARTVLTALTLALAYVLKDQV